MIRKNLKNNLLFMEIIQNKIEKEINIFLCGSSPDQKDNLRIKLNDKLKQNSKVNILYPEWLFDNLYEGENKEDLVTLEKKLGEDVDTVILPLESPGTFCELGVFVSNEIICKKLIVINDKKFKGEKSFINVGPIRLIKKNKFGDIIYGNFKDCDEIVEMVNEKIRNLKYKQKNSDDYENLFILTHLVGLLITIYQPVSKSYLKHLLQEFIETDTKKYLSAAISLLFHRKQIIKSINLKNEEEFSLSASGINDFHQSFERLGVQLKYINLRTNALWTKNKKNSTFNSGKEYTRLLEKNK